ncbi:MAG TPA: hypothetical protein VGH48_11740 [Caldimonas sp.]|jgi:hypothetical protein
MKTILALALAAATVGSASAQTSVSIGINQPGVYGRVTIGDVPAPALWHAEPVIVAPPRVVVQQQPVYLYVPPAHQQNWRRYCAHYHACGQPVYFVRDEWVRERWDHEHPDHGHGHGPDKHKDNDHGHDHDNGRHGHDGHD